MVFAPTEFLDMALMTLIIGYLFKDAFQVPEREDRDILDRYTRRAVRSKGWSDFGWACALVGTSILLHEMGHKFTALGFGLDATFHAACSSANIGTGGFLNGFCLIQLAAVGLKLLGFGFVIFVPGFVSMSGSATALQSSLIAFAGPLVHLVLWLGAALLLRDKKRMRKMAQRSRMRVFFFKQINMFLFILNLIPIPGFDGWHVFSGLYRAFF